MLEYLSLLHIASDTSRPLPERWGVMNVLDTVKGYLEGDELEAYQRIKEDIMGRIKACCNPAHSPK